MRIVLTAMAAFLLAVGSFANPLLTQSPQEREVHALLNECRTYRTYQLLELTPKQREAMLTVALAQVLDNDNLRTQYAATQPAMLSAMQNLRTAVLANGGVSDEVKNGVGQAESVTYHMEKRLEIVTRGRAQKAWSLLTTTQGARLRRLMGAGYENEETLVRQLMSSLRQPLTNPAGTLDYIYSQYGLRGGELNEARYTGLLVTQRWQALNGEQSAATQEQYLRDILALPQTGILYPTDKGLQGFIASTLFTPLFVHLLSADVPLPIPSDGAKAAELDAATNDVQVMNLVNTLYLSPEQSRTLINIQQRARQEYAALHAPRALAAQQSLPALRLLRDAFANGKPKSWALPSYDELTGGGKEYQEKLAALDAKYLKEMKTLLTDNQVTMVANFVPCTVPVQSLTNPERVGQADDSSGLELALARIRALPASRVKGATDALILGVASAFREKHYSSDAIDAVVMQIPGIVSQIRDMDDTEFGLKKSDLASTLMIPDHIAEGAELDGRILGYLLRPNLPPILQQRLASAGPAAAVTR